MTSTGNSVGTKPQSGGVHPMNTPLEALERLKELAKAATPGPWEASGTSVQIPRGGTLYVSYRGNGTIDDAAFIAAVSPTAFLEIAAAYEAQGERLREVEGSLEKIAAYQWPVIVGHRMIPFSIPETGYYSETREAFPSESPLQALKSVNAIARAALTQPPATENGE